ncbi:MAG: ATP-binding protein [Pseudomonadota bacterium]
MAIRQYLKRFARILPLAVVVGVLLTALFLVAGVERETAQLGRLSLFIFLLTGIALLALVCVILYRLARLIRRVRSGQPGAKLRARLVMVFVALALPPVVIVYLFSAEFLSETIEGWLDVGTETALSDSIEISQMLIDTHTRAGSEQLADIAARLPLQSEQEQVSYLFRLLRAAGPVELTLLDSAGQVQTLVHVDPARLVADLPSTFALAQAVRGQEYATVEPISANSAEPGLQVRVLTPVEGTDNTLILQGIFPLPEGFSTLAGNIEQAYFRHENVAFLRDRLQQSFVLILTLVLAITALLAMLLAFNSANRVVRPISDLAGATELMRAGHFPEELAVNSRDELGFLVESFNRMARELNRIQQELETQRQELETLLSRLSAGVMAFDHKHRLTRHNDSAAEILGIDLAPLAGSTLAELIEHRPALQALFATIEEKIDRPGQDWRQEIKLEQSERTLALVCRGSKLPGPNDQTHGHVVVFDDVTMLDQAQREAAWAELARRLAHEVKNPLTPIRLAAERLQLRVADELEGDARDLLQRATGTIINQVDALRQMVDAFGDYSRPSRKTRQPLDIHKLIHATVELWTTGDSGIRFTLELNADIRQRPPLGDAGQFGQVLNNLVRNAREAHPQASPEICIRTGLETEKASDSLLLQIDDDGPGFQAEILPNVFEPYVTTKQRGTGLGLAIVHRMIDEMGGRIQAQNRTTGGGRISIWLPLSNATQ